MWRKLVLAIATNPETGVPDHRTRANLNMITNSGMLNMHLRHDQYILTNDHIFTNNRP
jgi:hypothetical protein